VPSSESATVGYSSVPPTGRTRVGWRGHGRDKEKQTVGEVREWLLGVASGSGCWEWLLGVVRGSGYWELLLGVYEALRYGNFYSFPSVYSTAESHRVMRCCASNDVVSESRFSGHLSEKSALLAPLNSHYCSSRRQYAAG